jgi:hypothetical protein
VERKIKNAEIKKIKAMRICDTNHVDGYQCFGEIYAFFFRVKANKYGKKYPHRYVC